MIQSNELRIGNVVMWNMRSSNTVKKTVDIEFLKYLLNNEGFERIDPILLTPEILVKCGFQEVKGKQNIFQFGRVQLFGSEIYEAYLKHEDRLEFSYIPTGGIKCLHQLQNLYFALTGEELKVNL